MTTLKDLSHHLGLSITQVSRALNDHTDVSADTKQRVRAAAKTLNYTPNLTAKRLQSGRSGIVGVVLSAIPRPSGAPMFMRVFGGMSSHFWRHGIQLALHIADPDEDIVGIYRRLIASGSMDGFVVFEPVVDDVRIRYLIDNNIPFVVHGRSTMPGQHPYFDIDNHDVGYRLTRHLIAAGHRRIGFLNGLANRTYAVSRHDGYRDALAEAGIAYDPALHLNGEMVEPRAIVDTVRMFSAPQDPPTGIIAGSPLIAKGVYVGLRASGLQVPHDVSVVAHDDLVAEVPLAGLDPAVTATQAAIENSWKPLSEYLVGAIQQKPITALQDVEKIDFVSRNSVAPPPDTRQPALR